MNKLKITKRQISDHKFSRIFAQNLDNIGVAYKTDSHGTTVNSAQAVKVGRIYLRSFPLQGTDGESLEYVLLSLRRRFSSRHDYICVVS